MASLFRETVASQYFLELAKYVGLPVIAWNADNAALEKAKDMVSRDSSYNCLFLLLRVKAVSSFS